MEWQIPDIYLTQWLVRYGQCGSRFHAFKLVYIWFVVTVAQEESSTWSERASVHGEAAAFVSQIARQVSLPKQAPLNIMAAKWLA